MAFLVPDNLKSRQDVAAPLRRVASAFQVGLDEDVLVWFEPLYDPAGERPHFIVLLPDRGIVALEVFEARARNILGIVRGRLRLERDGQEVEVHSPLARAEKHAESLAARVRAEARLTDVTVPIVAGAVFPAMERSEAEEKGLDGAIDQRKCIFKSEIEAAIAGTGETGLLRAITQMLGQARASWRKRSVERACITLDTVRTIRVSRSREWRWRRHALGAAHGSTASFSTRRRTSGPRPCSSS